MCISTRLFLLLALCCPALAFSSPASFSGPSLRTAAGFQRAAKTATARSSPLFGLRGGEQAEQVSEETSKKSISGSIALPMASSLTAVGQAYAKSLESRPIVTKSVTAGIVFFMSDWVAQRLETKGKKDRSIDWQRTISSGLVGLLYFGPAAHAWYEQIFRLLPGTSLVSTVQKAILGQLIFGPTFTMIFFGTALLNSGEFSLGNWWNKIRKDLPGAWVAGLGFWPFVDLISYSMIAPQWIPLFVNTCSFIWTIYLSLVANRSRRAHAA